MNQEKEIIDAAKALGLGDLIPEVYRDMLQPAVRQVGEGLAVIAKAVKISLAPLEAGVWGYQQIKEWLSFRVTSILAKKQVKKIQAAPFNIAGPLVLQLIFAKDEPDLKNLYASLLATAMDADDNSAHPSFVSIIQQLTPDEAKILQYVAKIDEKWPSLSEDTSVEGYAKDSVDSKFKKWCEEAGVKKLDGSETYMDNLIRLRIFRHVVGNDAKYEPPGYNRHGDYGASVSNTEYELLELTSFGRHFINACIESGKPNK
ncbi:MAG: DUF4393 domain-containing protein [Proteobacteria bacterium]|nr:DUF4393 domain-containing protein [Pseudomonadota bacterium]